MIAPDGDRVVYWIGASASWNALPVVEEMAPALEAQASYLQQGSGMPQCRHAIRQFGLKGYLTYLRRMASWSREYGTIDTYARSLFLLDRTKELAVLKLHIAMYFILEQVLPVKRIGPSGAQQSGYRKRDRIDTRYMAWLALMMDKDSGINPRVNIISWTYDLQLEYALATFRGHDKLGQLHKDAQVRIYPRPFAEETDYKMPPTLVRLNGVVGHSSMHGATKVLYGEMANDPNEAEAFIISLFKSYNGYDIEDADFMYSMVESLTFAWENNSMGKTARELGNMAMNKAKVLVVIGYSFPSFNRTVDKELCRTFYMNGVPGKRVLQQNKSMSAETFMSMMGQTTSTPIVSVESNVDQFHVPSEFF